MFRKSKSKSSVQLGSKESIESSRSNQSGSSGRELSGSVDRLVNVGTSTFSRMTKFEIHFLGRVENVNLGGMRRDPDTQLIDKVEEAQLEGKIRLFPREEDFVLLNISKHGLKVLNMDQTEVKQRHPLHTVAQIVFYEDAFFKSNIAIKIGQVGRMVYACYLFQCSAADQAQKVCSELKRVFDKVTHHIP